MKTRLTKKVITLAVTFTLILQQTGFAQGLAQLDIGRYMNQASALTSPAFRPLLLRYFSYNPLNDNFNILLDKGDLKKIEESQIKAESQGLLKYFLVGVALPDEAFWVNLRPDSQEQIIDPRLTYTDLGKVLLEADLQLKKDLARFTSPETQEGRIYWTKLYEKAGQLFGSENITIPTLTRPWIVPGEVIIRENLDSAYIYKATLKVMLEQDHLKNSTEYQFTDPRLKELNEYSAQLIRQNIIPKLTKEVNSAQKYAALRQVFYSLVLSRWFKAKFTGKSGTYARLINSGNLNGLNSKENWSKATYFKEYQKSFANGEYNLKEQVSTITGATIRTYFSGGVAFAQDFKMPRTINVSSPVGTFSGSSPLVNRALQRNMLSLAGDASSPLGSTRLTPGFTSSPLTQPTPPKSASSSPVVTGAIANRVIQVMVGKLARTRIALSEDNQACLKKYLTGEVDREEALAILLTELKWGQREAEGILNMADELSAAFVSGAKRTLAAKRSSSSPVVALDAQQSYALLRKGINDAAEARRVDSYALLTGMDVLRQKATELINREILASEGLEISPSQVISSLETTELLEHLTDYATSPNAWHWGIRACAKQF